jgi:hypothetical protein
MKLLSTTLVLSLHFLSVLARSISLFGGSNVNENNNLPVKGENPFFYCSEEASRSHVVDIERVDLSPNPPQKGKSLVVKALGIVKEEIKQGAYVRVEVFVATHIKLLEKKFDLCELVEDVDIKCPVQKGETTMTKTVDLPDEIPPAKFRVVANAYTADDEPITCLTATVDFGHILEL